MHGHAILAVNAGPSSLKFSLCHVDTAGALQRAVRGQIDGIGSRPQFRVKDDAGRVLIASAHTSRRARGEGCDRARRGLVARTVPWRIDWNIL